MTRTLRRIVLFLLLVGFALDGSSKPLDSSAAQRLIELEKLSSYVNRSQPLSVEQWAMVETSLESGDDVSVAVATLFLQRIENERSRALLIKLSTSNNQRGLLADAVFKCEQMKDDLEKSAPEERAARWQKMAKDPNPYARIAAAKAICAIDPEAAKAVLLRLEEENSEISPVANRIRRELAANMGEKPPPPIPGFETPYIWFERSAGSLAVVRFADAMSSGGDDSIKEASSQTQTSQIASSKNKSPSTSPSPIATQSTPVPALAPPVQTPKSATAQIPFPSSFPMVPVAILAAVIVGIVLYILRRKSK